MMDDNQNAPREWPIAPTFLSLRQGCTEDTANYNTDGIYYTDYLRGFLADLSHDKEVQNALALFQFVPEDYLPNDPNSKYEDKIPTSPEEGTVLLNEQLKDYVKVILEEHKPKLKIIRIDSGTFVNNGKLCDVFRKCKEGNTNYCFQQDSIVGIFASEELNNFNPYSDDDRDKLESFIDKNNLKYIKVGTVDFEKKENNKRSYVHYTCPKSLFEEHIFPVCAHNRVVACLMLGQMARESFHFDADNKDKNKKSSFSQDLEAMEKEDSNCHKYLSEIRPLSSDDWNKKAYAIVNRIEIFEKRLEERINHRNSKYINREFEKIEEQFREDVKKINIRGQDAVEKFTKALSEAFDSIRNKFDNSDDGFIRMFALPIDIKHEELVPIGWSGAYFDKKDDFKFTSSQLKDIDKLSDNDIENKVKEIASNTIKEKYDKEKGDIFLAGWLAGREVAYIVWKRHDNNLKNNERTFETYKQALRNFYSIALECYSYIRGAKMESLLETTIQESAHESAHFILPAIDVVEKNLEAIPKDKVLPKFSEWYEAYIDSYEKYRDEVLESLHQLREINNGSSLILSPNLQIGKEKVEVFNLLYKLKKTLNNRALDSHKNIYYYQSEHYVTANIDEKYLNHALYNLLDNAIKYGYEGSYIRINMDVDRKENKLIIETVSYGIEIEPGDGIYQLYTRSEKAEKVAGGTGLGLYIVRKICEAHSGTITHTSEKLSDYNIPVLFNYKHRNTLANKNSLGEIKRFEKELPKLSGAIENEVVYDPRFVQYARVFSTRIYEPTYRNTFRITIPLN